MAASDRASALRRIAERRQPWDVVVIGGGATGAGVAVDAATRGYDVLLLERGDFGQATSSRSTKLIHGGVRYLKQARLRLVREGLRERGRLLRNAPHLVHALPFVIPAYSRWEKPLYGLGLWMYDRLAGKERLGASQIISRSETLGRLSTIQADGLRGGVMYLDGQFDDARLLIHLVLTAIEHGGAAVNYTTVVGLTKGQGGRVDGVTFRDEESRQELHVAAKAVVNATGAYCDEVRRMADRDAAPTVMPSQGAHVVLPRSFLPGDSALMVPSTPDGRVLFAIPWHGHVLVGTTDIAIPAPVAEPRAAEAEIDFLLEIAGRYLAPRPTRADVLSVFAGIRPLLKSAAPSRSSDLSRAHALWVDPSGLLTISGGKWTTYRQMAADVVDRAIAIGSLSQTACRTEDLAIHGARPPLAGHLSVYGADAEAIHELQQSPDLAAPLDAELPYTGAEVVWAARHEYARTVADVLARRTRALFLNAAAARRMAPRVAQLLAQELNRDAAWQSAQVVALEELARGYMLAD